MNSEISHIIEQFTSVNISSERKNILRPLIDFIQKKKNQDEEINLNFICTHNSRRSQLAQIWAQTMAYHHGISKVFCYSGGTEATAMFPKIIETLVHQGFHIYKKSETDNPIYLVKFAKNENAIVCFSKVYNDEFNPNSNYAAIMTCDSADEGCPIVFGASVRIPIKYSDPKSYDGTALMNEKYAERSLEIGQEMSYVFSKII